MASEAIKHILSQQGWVEIEAILKDEILDSRKLTDFKTDDKTAEQIAREVIARKEAAKIIDKALKRIKREGTLVDVKKESWK
jgi:hypothetical protein